MKKFMKTCAILALILIVMGMGMALVSGAIHGPITLAQLRKSVYWDDDFQESLEGQIVAGLEHLDSGQRYELEEHVNFDSDNPIYEGDTEQTFSASEIRDLEIEAGACGLEVKDSEDGDFHVKVQSAGSYQGYVKNGTLHIRSIRRTTWGDGIKCLITVYVPVDFTFEDVELSLGAGQIDWKSAMRASEVEVELGAGEIALANLTAGKLTAEVGMGSLEVAGDIREEADVTCAMGNVDLELAGAESSFNYKVEVAAGNVTIGGKPYSGLAKEKDIDNNALKDISVECAMGNISVSFTE